MAKRGKVVGAGKTVDLVVRTSGIDNGEQAEFEIFKALDGSSLDSVSGKVNNGKATATWTAKGPEPDADEQEWDLYYKVTCKGLETKASGLKVYTDWIEVETVDQKDEALKGAAYQLRVKSTKRRGDSGVDAKFKEEELPHGKIKIDWQDPFFLMEWVDDKGPKRKAKVRKVLKPKLLWPTPKKRASHKQWVNLAADAASPEFGNTIKIRVTLEGGLAGDYLYVKTKFGAKNSKRNSPAPGLDGATCTEWASEGGKEFTLDKAESASGEIEVEVELGHAGGDVIDLWFSGSEEFRKAKTIKLRIVNWRKIYYQITCPDGRRIHSMKVAKGYLRKQIFLDYEKYKSLEVDATAAPSGSWIPGRELGKKSDQLNIGSTNRAWFWGKFADDKAPVGCHIIVCDTQYDEGTTQTIEAIFSGVIGKVPIDDPDDYDCFSKSLKDGNTALKSGSWESQAPAGHPDNGKTGTVEASWFTCNLKKYPDKVRVVLKGDAGKMVGKGRSPKGKGPTDKETKHPVKVKIQIEVAMGPFLGEQAKQHQLIVLVPNKKAFNHIVVHELGHALMMALTKVAPGLDAADHKNCKYTTADNKDHYGDHCRHGFPKRKWTCASYQSYMGKCVMWGGVDGGATPPSRGFCKLCIPFAVAYDCKKIPTS